MWKWTTDLLNLLFPPLCLSCEEKLLGDEKHLCTDCLQGLPTTQYHLYPENPMEQLFWGRFPVERATAHFVFNNSTGVRQLLHHIKYNRQVSAATYLGAHAARQIASTSDFFSTVDLLLPVPLHRKRLQSRGYNQSRQIAFGISSVTAIPMADNCVGRHKNNRSQTQMDEEQRWANVDQIFSVDHPEPLRGKHILLVDDMLTSGATITSLGQTIARELPDVRFSVFSLAMKRI